MDNVIFNKLLQKLQESLTKLNMGYTITKIDMSELWTLLHHLHFTSYDSNSCDLFYKLKEYYE